MQHERFYHHLFQALVQAGLEPVSFQERLDTSDLTREVNLGAVLPGQQWPARTSVEFSYYWTAADTARSQGEIEPDPLGDVVELTCTLKYSPREDDFTVQVGDLEKLRAFLRALVDKLPLALKDEQGNNAAEARVLMGEGDDMLLYGPVLFQLNQIIQLEEEEEDDGSASTEHELQATLRDLAADALRGLMALDTLQAPDGLFEPLPEEEETEEEGPPAGENGGHADHGH